MNENIQPVSSETLNILKETYCNHRERYYVKPLDQTDIVVINKDREKYNPANWIKTIFLPQGYPDSVSGDYTAYQIWDTAQAFCSTISGILATQEVLKGIGVGNKGATPLAATITWIMKDGCGHIGRILFAYTHGHYLDAYSKKWRLYADILNNAAMCIEIALPMFTSYATFALCVSTTMKSIVGVAGGATRIAMTQHHAISSNLADVAAKDSAQETAVNLIASVTALAVVSTIGNSLTLFVLMMILHVTFNYLAVRAVCLRTFNEPRFLLVIDRYLRQEVVAAPCEINRLEPVVFYQMGSCILDIKMTGFKIRVGHSLHTMFKTIKSYHLQQLCDIYGGQQYLIVPCTSTRLMHVLLKREAKPDDVLCGFFHGTLLAIITCAINDVELPAYQSDETRPFAAICRTLQAAAWSRHEARAGALPHEPSFELMIYVEKVIRREWPQLKDTLELTGWDLSKHLIVCDEWRIDSGKLRPQPMTPTHHISTTMNLLISEKSMQTSDYDCSHIIEPDPSNPQAGNKKTL